jgi:hypothetical protein
MPPFAVPPMLPFAVPPMPQFAVQTSLVGNTATPMECMCQEYNNYNRCILCKS